jgi:hypothetical protein
MTWRRSSNHASTSDRTSRHSTRGGTTQGERLGRACTRERDTIGVSDDAAIGRADAQDQAHRSRRSAGCVFSLQHSGRVGANGGGRRASPPRVSNSTPASETATASRCSRPTAIPSTSPASSAKSIRPAASPTRSHGRTRIPTTSATDRELCLFDANQPRGGRGQARRAVGRRRYGVAVVRQGLGRRQRRRSARRPRLTSHASVPSHSTTSDTASPVCATASRGCGRAGWSGRRPLSCMKPTMPGIASRRGLSEARGR